jgi:hypothetical protein
MFWIRMDKVLCFWVMCVCVAGVGNGFEGALGCFGGAAPKVLRGCHQLGKLGSANHHPQKRHLPRQAGLTLLLYGCKWLFFAFILALSLVSK